MCTQLHIQVSSALQPQKLELDILYNEGWTADSEAVLLQRIHEIFSMIRDDAKALRINLDIDVKNPTESLFKIRKKLQQHERQEFRQEKLSMRELEILGLIMLGYTNQQISEKLFISYETVRSHRKNIFAKTGAHNTATLINYYHQTFFEK